jgi:hypothetical protein
MLEAVFGKVAPIAESVSANHIAQIAPSVEMEAL